MRTKRRTWAAIFCDKFKKCISESEYSDFDLPDYQTYYTRKVRILKMLNNKLLRVKSSALIPYTVYQRYNNIVVYAERILKTSFNEYKFKPDAVFTYKHEEYMSKEIKRVEQFSKPQKAVIEALNNGWSLKQDFQQTFIEKGKQTKRIDVRTLGMLLKKNVVKLKDNNPFESEFLLMEDYKND